MRAWERVTLGIVKPGGMEGAATGEGCEGEAVAAVGWKVAGAFAVFPPRVITRPLGRPLPRVLLISGGGRACMGR